MKPRFLADADLNQKIVLGLLRREPSIDIHTASQGDIIGRPDQRFSLSLPVKIGF